MLKHLPERIRKQFISDGCTMFLNGYHTSCCIQHDNDYAIGIDRKEADLQLKKCIRRVREEDYRTDVDRLHLVRSRLKFWTWPFRLLGWSCFFQTLWLPIKYTFWKIMAVVVYLAVRTFGWYFWERGRWFRESKPTGDNWWVKGRLKMIFLSKYR